jgi:hypothetical protein
MVAGFAELIEIRELLVAVACNHPNYLVSTFSRPDGSQRGRRYTI